MIFIHISLNISKLPASICIRYHILSRILRELSSTNYLHCKFLIPISTRPHGYKHDISKTIRYIYILLIVIIK